jgi:hypothetical protein
MLQIIRNLIKKALNIILILLFSTSIKAQFGGYQLSIEITTVDDHTSNGYSYVASNNFNLDSLENTNYLFNRIDQGFEITHPDDSFSYFKNRINYSNEDYNSDNKLFYLLDPVIIESKNIKSISIKSMDNQSTMIGFSNILSLSDTTWIMTNPIEKHSYSGYLCHYEIFVHEKTKKNEEIITRLELYLKEIENIKNDNELDTYIDEKILKILEELNGQKVIVISQCSC